VQEGRCARPEPAFAIADCRQGGVGGPGTGPLGADRLGVWRCRHGESRSIWRPPIVPKEGSHYDLPIALGLMAAIGAIPPGRLSGFTVLGNSASRNRSHGAGSAAGGDRRQFARRSLICPAVCGAEAAWASPDIQIVAANSLIQIAITSRHAGAVAAAAESP